MTRNDQRRCSLARAGGVIAILVWAGTSGCGDGSSGSGSASATGALETWSVKEPPVSIGGSDERADYLLEMVLTATRLSDGRIVIADQATSQLKYYDESGNYLYDAGGAGDGPGEMSMLMDIARLPGDSVAALSFRPGLSLFGPDGQFVDSRRLNLVEIGDQTCRMTESDWYVLSDGSILTGLMEVGREGCPESTENPRRLSTLVGRYSPETDDFDTLTLLPGHEYDETWPRAYGRSISISMTPGRVYAGDTGSDSILRFDLPGNLRTAHAVPFDPVLIPSEAKQARPPERPADLPSQFHWPTAYVFPERYPRFGRILAAPDRELWVMAYPTVTEAELLNSWSLTSHYNPTVEVGGARWTVLDEDGTPIAEIRTPPDFFALEVGDGYVLGVSRDEFDRQSVELYEVRR